MEFKRNLRRGLLFRSQHFDPYNWHTRVDKRQFLVKIGKSERRLALSAFGLLVFFWLTMFEVVPAVLRNVPDAAMGTHTRLIIFEVAGVLLVAGFVAISRRMRGRLNCPSCKKSFEERELLDLGYVEKCSSCGAQVFNNKSAGAGVKTDGIHLEIRAAAASRIDKAEFFAAIQAYRRDVADRSWRVGVLAFAPGLIAFAVTLILRRGHAELGRFIAGVLGVGGLLAALTYSVLANRRAVRRHALVCPACGIYFTTVQLWDLAYLDQCAGCGERVFG